MGTGPGIQGSSRTSVAMLSINIYSSWPLIASCMLLCSSHPLPDSPVQPCQISRRDPALSLDDGCLITVPGEDGRPIPGVTHHLNLIPMTGGQHIDPDTFTTFIHHAIANSKADTSQFGEETEITLKKKQIKNFGLEFYLEHDKVGGRPFTYGLIVEILEQLEGELARKNFQESTLIVIDYISSDLKEVINSKGLIKLEST